MKKMFFTSKLSFNTIPHPLVTTLFFPILTSILPLLSFSQEAWIQKSDFPGLGKYGTCSFSIGTKGYIGIGYMASGFPTTDFWEWDQATNGWTSKAGFPGNIEGYAVGFSIGTKGYIGTGNARDFAGFTNEFWEYDPATDKWTQKASLPIPVARSEAVGFSIGAKGYIGLGMKDPYTAGSQISSENFEDFWEWDQATNVWTKKADFGGAPRNLAVGFSIGNKGYIGTGWANNDILLKDFWEWDQITDKWTIKAEFGGTPRFDAVGFSIGNKGYVGTGLDNISDLWNIYRDLWEWDQTSNVWIFKADFAGIARADDFGFAIGDKGYIGNGYNFSTDIYYQDFWEFNPPAITSINEVARGNDFFFPNPASDFIILNVTLSGNAELTLNIYTVSGVLVHSQQLRQDQQKVSINNLTTGIYFVEIKSDTGSKKQKLIVERTSYR
jgi:hypothetical protein